MNLVKPFSKQLVDEILKKVDALLKSQPGPHYAAFDADGTLWDSDVGECFFQYQIDHLSLPQLNGLDPWDHYEKLKQKHPPEAYLWLARLCADKPLAEVRAWAKAAVDLYPPLVFESQRKLIKELVERGINIFVVSASVHWAVEAALPVIGLPSSSALGVKTKVINGTVTLEGDGPVTWREGKRVALLEKTKGVAPLLCSGNSSGDVHLLEASTGVALAVQSQLANSTHSKLYSDEQVLFSLAAKNGWLTHSFR